MMKHQMFYALSHTTTSYNSQHKMLTRTCFSQLHLLWIDGDHARIHREIKVLLRKLERQPSTCSHVHAWRAALLSCNLASLPLSSSYRLSRNGSTHEVPLDWRQRPGAGSTRGAPMSSGSSTYSGPTLRHRRETFHLLIRNVVHSTYTTMIVV